MGASILRNVLLIETGAWENSEKDNRRNTKKWWYHRYLQDVSKILIMKQSAILVVLVNMARIEIFPLNGETGDFDNFKE